MPRITAVIKKPEKGRVYVYVDGTYCCSVRERTWQGMNLDTGSEMDCPGLKRLEKFYWKQAYGEAAWQREKQRIRRVCQWFGKYLPGPELRITGFGADSDRLIETHPEEAGAPDISLILPETGKEIIALEVTGTERLRGTDYWVRPDKLAYARNHPERDVWIVLHYREPEERFIWLRPVPGREYPVTEKTIRGAVEYYVTFRDSDPEIKSSQEFHDYASACMKQRN